MDNICFSVLMSLYAKERPEYLCQSLDSVFNQTLPPDEVVMVEDGPLTPELYNVLDEYAKIHPELKRIPLKENSGLGKALNEGLKNCTHDIVARMDTDDIASHDRFEKQLRVFKIYPQAEVVSSWITEFENTPDNVIAIRKLPEFPYEIYKYGKKRCPVNHPAVMFKRHTVQFAGGYLPFPLFEDYYLWVRLLMNGATFYNIQECLLNFRTSLEMYKRRGGWEHGLNEIKFQFKIRRLGYINTQTFLMNVSIRFFTRVIPNSWRVFIYKHLLRR